MSKRKVCRECARPARWACARCKSSRCFMHIRFAPTKEVGIYRGRCSGKCRLRMKPEVAALVGERSHVPLLTGALEDLFLAAGEE